MANSPIDAALRQPFSLDLELPGAGYNIARSYQKEPTLEYPQGEHAYREYSTMPKDYSLDDIRVEDGYMVDANDRRDGSGPLNYGPATDEFLDYKEFHENQIDEMNKLNRNLEKTANSSWMDPAGWGGQEGKYGPLEQLLKLPFRALSDVGSTTSQAFSDVGQRLGVPERVADIGGDLLTAYTTGMLSGPKSNVSPASTYKSITPTTNKFGNLVGPTGKPYVYGTTGGPAVTGGASKIPWYNLTKKFSRRFPKTSKYAKWPLMNEAWAPFGRDKTLSGQVYKQTNRLIDYVNQPTEEEIDDARIEELRRKYGN